MTSESTSKLHSILRNLCGEDSDLRSEAASKVRRRLHSPSKGWYEAVSSIDPRVRSGAALAALQFKEIDGRIIEILASLIDDPDQGVRHSACSVLGDWEARSIGALPRILAAIDDGVWFVRQAAVEAAASVSPSNVEVLVATTKAATDSVWNVRFVAIESHSKCIQACILQVVRPAILDQEPAVRRAGLKSLLHCAESGVIKKVRGEIEQCLNDSDYAVRCAATRLARRLRSSLSDTAKQAIERNAKTSDPELSRLSAALLRRL